MAEYPCPRCLIPKVCIHKLGTKHDKRQRISLARVDNLRYRANILNARKIIYEKNRTVNSVFVQNLLKSQSLVPTEVCSLLFSLNGPWLIFNTECILRKIVSLWIQLLLNFSSGFHAWVRAWCVEKGVYPPTSNFRMCTRGYKWVRSKVSKPFKDFALSHSQLITCWLKDFATCQPLVEIPSVDLQTMSLS